jgi:phage terminase Nu1 subunit (DNA packaging protein)
VSEISEALPGALKIVNNNKYQEQLNDSSFPELANSFLCQVIIQQENKDIAAATWSFLHAAWVCNNSRNVEQAIECRRRAAETLRIAEDKGQEIGNQAGVSTAILVDLLQRSGQIDDAKKIIKLPQGQKFEDLFNQILDFQAELLAKNDLNCHAIDEVLGGNKSI